MEGSANQLHACERVIEWPLGLSGQRKKLQFGFIVQLSEHE